jgi:hypothetical protein
MSHPEKSIVKTLHDCASVAVADGTTPTPLSVTAKLIEGGVSVSNLWPSGRGINAYQSRARTTSVRRGAREYPQVTFQTQHTGFLTTTGAGSFDDMIHGAAGSAFAGRVTVAAGLGDVPLFNVTFTKAIVGNETRATIVLLQRCAFEATEVAEGEPDTKSYTITCYGDVFLDGVKIGGDQIC